MTDPGPVLFKTSLRANPWRLLAIWVFLIVLPVILLFAATDSILTEGEQQLEEKIKLQLHQELVDFRDSLSFSSFLETRLSECTGPLLANPEMNAGQLANLLHSSLTFQPAAVFSYHVASDQFSMSVHEAVKRDLGLISRTMMKNLLTRQVGSAARVTNNSDSASLHRSRGYLRSLLSSPGILQLKTGRALGAFSGKPSLGRLLIYYLQTPGQPEAGSGHILIFRERDIPVRKLVEKACGEVSNHGFTRQFTSSDEGWRAIYRLSNDRMQFHGSRQHGYSLTALPTADLLLRLATGGTLYPARLPELIARLPILSVTAPAAIMQHPLRGVITSTRLPALLMVLVASMVILRLYFFGFGSSLRIGPRLFISVLAASLLPFSTLIVAAAWHEQFIKDFAISEMTQHIQLQADQINRTITASLNARERELADLTKFLGSLDFNAAASFLKRWLPAHSATMAIYNENEREIIVVIDKNEKLNEFETDMKDLGFVALRNSLKPVGPDGMVDPNLLGMVSFKSKGIGVFLESVGTLHRWGAINPGLLYATMPVFARDNRFAEAKALTLFKFKARDLLARILHEQPELLANQRHGDFLVQKCFIPVELPAELPESQAAFYVENFDFAAIKGSAEKTLKTCSSSSWEDRNTLNTATFLHNLNCILIIRAIPLNESQNSQVVTLLIVAGYFLLIVMVLVMFLRRTLVKPIQLLRNSAERVAAGNYTQHINFRSGDEFEPLTEAFNEMTAGLLQKERLSSYVSDSVIQEVEAASGLHLQPGGERIDAAVLFISIAGFKDFRSQASPEEVTAEIGFLIDIAAEIADRHHGTIDKLVEETLMLVFRSQNLLPNHAENDYTLSACRAALGIREAICGDGKRKIMAGIASGPAVSGKIGSKHGKLDFTVIGNPVNLASRLKAQATRATQTGIIICPNSIRLLKGSARLRFIERTEIKGRSRTFPLYELLEIR